MLLLVAFSCCGARHLPLTRLASSAAGPTANGKIAVVLGLAVVAAIACANTFRKEK